MLHRRMMLTVLMLTWSRSRDCRSEVSKQRKDIYRKGDAIFHDPITCLGNSFVPPWIMGNIIHIMIPNHSHSTREFPSRHFSPAKSPAGPSVSVTATHCPRPPGHATVPRGNPTGELEWLSGGRTFTTFRSDARRGQSLARCRRLCPAPCHKALAAAIYCEAPLGTMSTEHSLQTKIYWKRVRASNKIKVLWWSWHFRKGLTCKCFYWLSKLNNSCVHTCHLLHLGIW